jgi:hypothetical protein
MRMDGEEEEGEKFQREKKGRAGLSFTRGGASELMRSAILGYVIGASLFFWVFFFLSLAGVGVAELSKGYQ